MYEYYLVYNLWPNPMDPQNLACNRIQHSLLEDAGPFTENQKRYSSGRSTAQHVGTWNDDVLFHMAMQDIDWIGCCGICKATLPGYRYCREKLENKYGIWDADRALPIKDSGDLDTMDLDANIHVPVPATSIHGVIDEHAPRELKIVSLRKFIFIDITPEILYQAQRLQYSVCDWKYRSPYPLCTGLLISNVHALLLFNLLFTLQAYIKISTVRLHVVSLRLSHRCPSQNNCLLRVPLVLCNQFCPCPLVHVCDRTSALGGDGFAPKGYGEKRKFNGLLESCRGLKDASCCFPSLIDRNIP